MVILISRNENVQKNIRKASILHLVIGFGKSTILYFSLGNRFTIANTGLTLIYVLHLTHNNIHIEKIIDHFPSIQEKFKYSRLSAKTGYCEVGRYFTTQQFKSDASIWTSKTKMRMLRITLVKLDLRINLLKFNV